MSPDHKTSRYNEYNEEIKDYKRIRGSSHSPSRAASSTSYSPQSPVSSDYNRNPSGQDINENNNTDSDTDMFICLTDSLTKLGLERKKVIYFYEKLVYLQLCHIGYFSNLGFQFGKRFSHLSIENLT